MISIKQTADTYQLQTFVVNISNFLSLLVTNFYFISSDASLKQSTMLDIRRLLATAQYAPLKDVLL